MGNKSFKLRFYKKKLYENMKIFILFFFSKNNIIKHLFKFSFLECASLCSINNSCMVFHFNKTGGSCNLGNRTDFKIQTNKTLWSADLLVHVKDGVNVFTNSNPILYVQPIVISRLTTKL